MLHAIWLPWIPIAVLVMLVNPPLAFAFKWDIKDTLPPKKIITLSERYMFATKNGPTMLEQGDSYISANAEVTIYMLNNRSTSIALSIVGVGEGHHHDTYQGMCDDRTRDVVANGDPNKFTTEVR